MTVRPNLDLNETIQDIDLDNRVHQIILDNPQRKNAFTASMYSEVRDGILHAYNDDRVEAVVIRGSGGSFASGGDLGVFLEHVDSDQPEALQRTDVAYSRVPFRAALRCPKPIVCLVDGLCLAGGLVLAACSDVVIATADATFGVPEARVGIFEPFITEILPLVIGLSRARYLAVTGATIDARTAERWGIVTCLAENASEAEVALDVVLSQIRGTSPEARAYYKRGMTQKIPDTDLLENFRVALSANGREGLRAFRDKREPVWAPLTVHDLW